MRIAVVVLMMSSLNAMEIPPGEPLILPSTPISDDFAHAWTFGEDGSLQEEDADQGGMFKSAGRLLVNNQPFTASSSQLIRVPGDPDPWMALGSHPTDNDLEVARFIHVSRKNGICRWLDVVTNGGADRRQVPIRVQYEFNWAPRTLEWRRDEHKTEIGALLQFGSRRASAVALWWGGEGRMVAREGIATATLDTVVEIPAGETVGLMHAAAVRAHGDEAQQALNGWDAEQLGKALPWLPELRLINIRLGTTAIDAMRSPGIDAIQLMSGERLRGSVMTTAFKLTSALGSKSAPRADIAGFIRRSDGRFSIFTHDGGVVAGTVASTVSGNSAGDTVTLALPTGDEMSIPLVEIRILAMRLSSDAVRPEQPPSSGWEISIVDQQRFFAKQLQGPLLAVTAIGALEIPYDAIASLEGYHGGPLTIVLTNGSRLHAIGKVDTITAVCADGNSLALPLSRIQRLRRLGELPETSHASAVQITLVNGDVLCGALAQALTVANRYRSMQIVPDQVRGITIDGHRAQATVHFSDGSYLQGRLIDELSLDLPWGIRVQLPQIMLAGIDVGSVGNAAKRVEDEAKTMLRDLSSPDAAKAQASGAWLAEHRAQLRSFLNRAYESGDLPPSAQRRLGLIIGKEF